MNQAIQVIDGCTYIATKKALKVDVMASGQLLACYISGSDKKSLINLYKTKQFEIEELLEQQCTEEKYNSDGEIYLTVEEVTAY